METKISQPTEKSVILHHNESDSDQNPAFLDCVHLIRRRYIHERAIYTWCGIALVAVNPYQEQDIYGEQVVETYHSASHSVYLQLDPHIYAVTEDAYSKLELNCKDQSIIVSGESGAGKTVSAKHAMRYLASIAAGGSLATSGGKATMRIENRVLASNPIMEAIGNASTVRNDNSSRFGKYIQIYFDKHSRKILGANMRTYLLEKSRVTKQQAGERNFHIFYQLLNYAHKNPQRTSHLKLLDEQNSNCMRKFAYLAGCEPQEARDDLKRFNEALQTLQIDDERIDYIYRIIAGILHAGNIKFKPAKRCMSHDNNEQNDDDDDEDDNDCPCTIDLDDFHFNAFCELLGVDKHETLKRLTVKLLHSGPRDIIEQPLNRIKAEHGRDAMLKYIYECLFTWLVALINLSLSSSSSSSKDSLLLMQHLQHSLVSCEPVSVCQQDTSATTKLPNTQHATTATQQQQQQQQLVKSNAQASTPKSPSGKKSILDHQTQPTKLQFIGVLDIYGFENFSINSFEQFCINYANEVLQQQYNQHVFKLEQEEYIREGIDWTFIEYNDNQPVIDIIESRPIGILNLLDEECRMPKGTDKSWCAKLYEHLGGKQANNSKISSIEMSNPFKRPKINYQTTFAIAHYAEDVTYNVETFLEKNRDTIAEEQCELLRNSHVLGAVLDDPLLKLHLQQRPSARRQTGGKMRSATVGYQFRGSLAALIRTLNNTEPHYIRCIKPNDNKKAFEFNEERAIQQLKACGVYETIRISNNGFPSRWLYKDFAKRYCVLIHGFPVFDKLMHASLARRQASQQHAITQAQSEQQDDNNNLSSLESDTCDTVATTQPLENGFDNTREELANVGARKRHFMSQFSSSDIRPICEAICATVYSDSGAFKHLRTSEEQQFIDALIERHGKRASAIYQFGKTKIFFRAGQVGYLERIRSQRLREFTVTIQRHVRGWLARRSFLVRRELFLEQMRREASLISLQNQVSSLQTELEQVKEEREEQVSENISRLGSMYQLAISMMYASVQPLIINAVLEYEALEPAAEPFASLDSSSSSSSTRSAHSASACDINANNDGINNGTNKQHSMECLIKELDKFYDLMRKSCVPDDIAIQAFKQLFYLINAHSLNQLLIRRDLCQFRKAMQINFNLSSLVQWCRERYLIKWRDIVEQLDPITQATKLLQTRKSSEDITTIDEVCNKLRPSQIIKILNMYTSTYEEQITIDFIHELEDHLNNKNNNTNNTNNNRSFNNNDLLMDTKHYFEFVDVESC